MKGFKLLETWKLYLGRLNGSINIRLIGSSKRPPGVSSRKATSAQTAYRSNGNDCNADHGQDQEEDVLESSPKQR